MSEIDIVARLQLRAEQFSSETGQRFAELKTRAQSTAQGLRNEFAGAFADVQRLAATSLQLPRTDTGSLDLSSEIKQLNLAALAADQNAQALRELSIAQEAAAISMNEGRQALLLEADASAVAALAEERNAQAIRDRVLALEAVQRELNQTTSQTRALTAAEEEAAMKAQKGGASFTMVGQQLNDFAVQVMSGQSASIAFAQQLPQLTFALSTMGGTAGRIGTFMTGPWGTAMTIAAVVMVPLIAKALDFGDAAEEAGKKAKDAAEGADAWADAAQSLGKVIDTTTGKLKTHNVVVAEAIRLEAIFKKQQGEKEAEAAEKAIKDKAGAIYSTPYGGSMYSPGVGPGASLPEYSNPKFKEVADKFLAGGYNTTADPSGLRGARIELEKLADASGKLDGKNVYDFVQDIVALGKARDKIAASGAEVDALDGEKMDSRFKPYKRDPKPKKGRDLSGMSNSAEEEISRINAAWDEQPKLIDKAFLETQKLDNLIGQLAKKKPPNWKQLVADAEAAKETITRGLITALGKAYEAPQTLFQKGMADLGALDAVIADLEKRKPPNWDSLVQQARLTGDVIRDGMNRPFNEFVRGQKESLAVGQLVLEGRDAEAEALRNTLALQQQLGRELKEGELATVLQLAEQHERITRALEDQRRVVGIYTGLVGDLQGSFRTFLDDLDGNTGSAFKNLVDNAIGNVKRLQRDLLSNAIFGGIDRQVEDYVRRMTGKQTPAEILADQAKDAGIELRGRVNDSGDALADFTKMVRATTDQLGGINAGRAGVTPAAIGAATAPIAALSGIAAALAGVGKDSARATAEAANDNQDDYAEIVVNGTLRKLDDSAGKMIKATDLATILVNGVAGNLEKIGIHVPKAILDGLKVGLPTVIQGVTLGQLGGSVFSSITGGKDNKLASSLGGVLGNMAGKELGKVAATAIGGGLGKALGSAAGPIGSIVGGILGNVVAGLFNSPKWSNASLSMNSSGQVVGTAGTGKGSAEIAAATGTASSVAEAVNSIVTQLGASITSLAPITMGTWDGRYRVADLSTTKALHSKNFGPDVLHDFGDDQQAAIQYAVAYEISHSVITGISEASKRILASGQNMETALNKVLMIEAIPKDLKAMLDPVGAAVDDLNRKWKITVDALKEGGASAEQMAQAQQLYDLQLEQVINTTASASQSLKDFLDTLKIGSASPLSLRDQESAALAKLQPFLEKINAGQSIDQDKYRDAAQAYLDIERELYGSTQNFFTAFDAVQAATNKAIAAIDNVAPVAPDVESPFAKSTAASTATTATNTQATADLLEEVRNLLQQLPSALAEQLTNDNGLDYLTEARLFKTG